VNPTVPGLYLAVYFRNVLTLHISYATMKLLTNRKATRMKIPVEVYEKVTSLMTTDYVNNLVMNVDGNAVVLQNISGTLYIIYTIIKGDS